MLSSAEEAILLAGFHYLGKPQPGELQLIKFSGSRRRGKVIHSSANFWRGREQKHLSVESTLRKKNSKAPEFTDPLKVARKMWKLLKKIP